MSQTCTPSRQNTIAARYLDAMAFQKDDFGAFMSSSTRKLPSNKSLNESTFTASTVMLDSSMGSWKSNDSSGSRSRSPDRASTPNNSMQSLDRSIDCLISTPVTPGRDSMASGSSNAPSQSKSPTTPSRRNLLHRFRRKRQQASMVKSRMEGDCSSIESTPKELSKHQAQHEQLAQPYQLQKNSTLSQPVLPHPSSVQLYPHSITNSTQKECNARILNSRIALRARSKGLRLFPKTTPEQKPAATHTQPRHPHPQQMPSPNQQEAAPTEIMTEVMQNLSSALGMESTNANLSEAGAPTEIVTNQTRKIHRAAILHQAPTLMLHRSPPQHALLDDATITSDQQSLPIKSLLDLQQSSSLSTINSLDSSRKVLHIQQQQQQQQNATPPMEQKSPLAERMVWERSLDSHFSQQRPHRSLNLKYSDDASSCYTQDREIGNDDMVQRVFSNDRMDLAHEVPIHPSLSDSRKNLQYAFPQIKSRHPSEVSLTGKAAPGILNDIPEENPTNHAEGMSFSSKEVHPPSNLQSEDMVSNEVHPLSVSKSASLEGLAFAYSKEEKVYEDEQDSVDSYFSTAVNPLSVTSAAGSIRDDDFDVYDDLENLQSSPSESAGFELTEANPAFVSANDNHLGLQQDFLEESSTAQSTSFLSTEANPPSIRSNDKDYNGQGATVPLSTPHSRLNSIINFGYSATYDGRSSLVKKLSFPPSQYKQRGLAEEAALNNGSKQYEQKEIQQTIDMMKRYRERSNQLDDTVKIQKEENEPLPSTNIAPSHWHEVQNANKASNSEKRRSFGSIKDRIKAFDKPKKIWKPPVKGKTRKSPRKKTGHPAPLTQDSVRPIVVVFPQDAQEEKKSEDAPLSYIRDDDGDTASVKSLSESWEKSMSRIFQSQSDKYNLDLDNDTINGIIRDDDDDCASVKSLRDKWEIRFSKVDLDQGIETDLEDDAGTVQSRRNELQKRLWDQQGIPRVVSVDENKNDDLNSDNGQSVKCLRKRYDVPKAPKRESVNRLRSMFEPSGPAASSSTTCSTSWRGKKSPSQSAATRSRSWNHSTTKSRSKVNHEDDLKDVSNVKRNTFADDIAPSELNTQDISAANGVTYVVTNGREDASVVDSCLQGRQTEMKELRTLMDVATSEKSVGPVRSHCERTMMASTNNVPYAAPKEVSKETRWAPSMQDRLDSWSTRLRAAKESPVCAQDSFSRDSLALDISSDGYGDVNPDQRYSEDFSETLFISDSSMSDVPIGDFPKGTAEPDSQLSPPSRGDPVGRSTSTDYSDSVTIDASIADVSNITDPSYLRSMGSRDTLSDNYSSPRRLKFAASPGQMTVETKPATLRSKPQRSTLSSMPEATNEESLEESDLRPKVPKDTPIFPQDHGAKASLSIPEQERHLATTKLLMKLNDDPLPSYDGDFVIDEERFKKQAASIPYYDMNTAKSVDMSSSSVSNSPARALTYTKVQTKLCMVPVVRRITARINDPVEGSGDDLVSGEFNKNMSIDHPSPVDFDQQQHTRPPKKQTKKVSFKLMDEHSMSSSEDSRVTEKTASSSEQSSLPSMPSQADKNYDAIMHERHQMLMERQRAHKERLAARQGANLSLSQHLVPQSESTNNSGKSEPVLSRRSAQGSIQARTQMKLFGRTHPIQHSAQGATKNNKVALRSLFSKKAQQQRSARTTTTTPVTPSRNLQELSLSPSKAASRSLFFKPTSAPSPSKAESRSLFSKKTQQQVTAQTLVTPPSNGEENPGLDTSPKRIKNPLKVGIPRYHPRRKQTTSLYNKMATTFGFGEPESAKDIVSRLQSYQSAHQQPVKNKHAFSSGLESDVWL